MFTFKFAGNRYEVSLENGEPEIVPKDDIGSLLVGMAFSDMQGAYFPSTAAKEFALSNRLGGDARPPSRVAAPLPPGAIP